jgi:hypothetical protein
MVAFATSGGAVATTTSRSVSRLARDARKVIEGSVDKMDAVELLLRIDAMRSDLASTPAAPICLWLKNLRDDVEQAL